MFNPDFKDMLSALSAANIDVLVVGAYAVAAHGHPRATGDLDIWVRAEPRTAIRISCGPIVWALSFVWLRISSTEIVALFLG